MSEPQTAHRLGFLESSDINHPALLDRHGEHFSELHFHAPHLDKLRSIIIRISASDSGLDREGVRTHLSEQGYEDLLDRLQALVGGRSDAEWFMRTDAALQDVEQAWLHLTQRHLKLQHQEELSDLVGQELSDAELDSLVMRMKAQLEQQGGEEASIDGYGIASGLTKTTE